ncbi:MAG: methyltransferase domain-containing protein [Proteobacteria bacterium]|nr:methyltransferase domain-containing protein [Pseudomonadota bacterium]
MQASILSPAEDNALLAGGLPKTGCMIDLGCGPGFVASRIGGFRPSLHWVGVDQERALLSHAGSASVVLADVSALPFRDEAFDGALARFVLRHVQDPGQALHEAARVVRRGGVVFALDADDDSLILHPEPEGFFELKSACQQLVRARGADPRLARRLPALFDSVGLRGIRVIPVPVCSSSIGVSAFAHLTLTPALAIAKHTQMGESRRRAATQAIVDWASSPASFGVTMILVVCGTRG